MPVKIFFWISLTLLLCIPSLPLFFFAPYLVASCYRYSSLAVLWRSLWVALLVSLFSSALPFTLLPITYCIVSFVIFLHTRTFFSDRWFTLPLMTYLFSLYASIVYFLLLPFFGMGISFSGQMIMREIFLAPLSDTLLTGIVSFILHRRKKAEA